jgi:type IV secretory pathway VirB10-like protein
MGGVLRFLVIAFFLTLVGLVAGPGEWSADAEFYKYVDKKGNVHFTDRLESIPEEYRNQIKEYKEMKQPEPPPPQEKEESKDRAAAERDRQMKEAEQKKREAEAKAAEEKSLQEEKLRIRQEKEKQIEELQEQITARQKEQRSLRTNWMVYDRIKLNQLNQEIEGLEKQIAALQKELSE